MHSISSLIVPAIALLSMVQYCPAPFIPAIAVAVGLVGVEVTIDAGSIAGIIGAAGGVAGAVEGGISAGKGARDIESVPRQFNSRIKRQDIANLGLGTAWQDCHTQLGSATLNFASTSATTVLVSGIPPACMTLSGVLTGRYNEGNPVPMGSDSVAFTNLSTDSLNQIKAALATHPNKHN